jgi:HSP20 family protein
LQKNVIFSAKTAFLASKYVILEHFLCFLVFGISFDSFELSLTHKKIKIMKPVIRKPINDPILSFFDDFLSNQLAKLEPDVQKVVPAVNIKETEKDVNIFVAAPGLNKKDFEISVDHNTLTISASKEVEKIEEGSNFVKKEFGYENFQRSFTLPEEVFDVENIKAAYKNGILELSIPKKEKEIKKVKKISVS